MVVMTAVSEVQNSVSNLFQDRRTQRGRPGGCLRGFGIVRGFDEVFNFNVRYPRSEFKGIIAPMARQFNGE